jgi:hypothetical protein
MGGACFVGGGWRTGFGVPVEVFAFLPAADGGFEGMADVGVAEFFVFFDVVPVEAARATADRGFTDGRAIQVTWTGHQNNQGRE